MAVPAEAASPATGTLSKTKKTLTWTGAATGMSMPTPPIDFGCNDFPDPSCDHYTLKINLGEGAKIEVTIKGSDPSNENSPTKPYNDFDVYIHAPDGTRVGTGDSPNGSESVTFIHRARNRNKPYDIAVRPWLVIPGANYKGSVKAITLGR
jgi:hypothetical protein